MNSMKRRREKTAAVLKALLLPIGGAAAVLCLLAAVSNLRTGSSAEGRRQLEDTIRRDVVTCYATEGVYPPSIAYLEQHYGLQIDRKHYTVDYDIFADNLMPDITVLENGG